MIPLKAELPLTYASQGEFRKMRAAMSTGQYKTPDSTSPPLILAYASFVRWSHNVPEPLELIVAGGKSDHDAEQVNWVDEPKGFDPTISRLADKVVPREMGYILCDAFWERVCSELFGL